MITIQNTKFYTVLEVAKTLNITPTTVRAYIRQGKLKGQRVGRPFLVSEHFLKEFLNSSVSTPEPERIGEENNKT